MTRITTINILANVPPVFFTVHAGTFPTPAHAGPWLSALLQVAQISCTSWLSHFVVLKFWDQIILSSVDENHFWCLFKNRLLGPPLGGSSSGGLGLRGRWVETSVSPSHKRLLHYYLILRILQENPEHQPCWG